MNPLRSPTEPYKILFLCTGNSARSILAEQILAKMMPGRFSSFSAGSQPKGEVHPVALRVLREVYGIKTDGARSKSWEEFIKTGVKFDFIITVCDSARETCPVFPGQPVVAHWSSPDPAAFVGNEEETYHYFWKVAQQIQRRLELLTNLPFEKLDKLRIEQETRAIGNQG